MHPCWQTNGPMVGCGPEIESGWGPGNDGAAAPERVCSPVGRPTRAWWAAALVMMGQRPPRVCAALLADQRESGGLQPRDKVGQKPR